MGTTAGSIEVYVTVDGHGGDREAESRRLYEELREVIEAVAAADRYRSLSPRVY